DYFKTTPISSDTFANLIKAPELLEDVGAQITPPVRAETFAKWIKVEADPDSDLVKLYLAARHPQEAVDWLNVYATNAVEYTRRLESKQLSTLAKGYLQKEVQEIDSDVTAVEHQFQALPSAAMMTAATNSLVQVDARLNALRQRMEKAVLELDDLRTKYTDINPKVQAQQEAISSLQHEMAEAVTNQSKPSMAWTAPVSGAGTKTANPELDILTIKLRALEDGRLELLKRLREAELYAANTPGAVRIFAPASLSAVKSNFRWLKLTIVPVFGAGLGLIASIMLVMLVEFFDRRLKNADDLMRVTQLPVLASLGNLRQMPPDDRAQWAFRAWTMLQGRLSPTANHGLICGITSSEPGEGRSTWISLLAEAASLTGFRVLTIATRPSPTHVEPDQEEFFEPPPPEQSDTRSGPNGHALTTSVLSAPSQVTEQLTGPNSQPVVHIPLPGWVWNLERRVQWREALDHWRQIENLVILVELPPASVPEAVLLGSNLPNLVWLASSGVPDAAETRRQLETLRNARCNLVGAVLNRVCGTPVRKLFPRWVGCLAIMGALTALNLRAQTAPGFSNSASSNSPPPAAGEPERGAFSIIKPAQRADWQRRLTLGPGDVLNLDLYGEPELSLKEVAIAPDGRLSYLEATNVLASGLTVDELRDRVDHELSRFRRAPHAIITPTAFRSKKYFVLGKVATKGVFILDRPLTVLEAIARAHGLETALVDRYLVELADFDHSFLARRGKRFPLNFDALFRRGDLAQNIAVEPDDYIYIAPGDVKQVYVVGEVRLPGEVVYTPNLTIMSAITQRGGYTERAFKARVLVIRGSLNPPNGIVVNTHAILDAVQPDFQLQPRDIIYVNSRPFIKVEEAADLAATAFIQSIITAWVGVDVVKPISQ
ncbi:MAG TPA: polysaccharide biosynthesis/export family protein, partial [Verrucomicrobiae bacterium]|nr:polysaccharide biosynthesis/export family protein [Verrucomicrobiae bacterium]